MSFKAPTSPTRCPRYSPVVGSAGLSGSKDPAPGFVEADLGDGIAGVGVGEDNFIVITTELSGHEPIKAIIAVGPDGTCACKISASGTHAAATAPDTGRLSRC